MTTPSPPRRRRLEREIIIAVIVLYLMITGVMVTVHYTQPAGPGDGNIIDVAVSRRANPAGKSDAK